MEGFQVPVDSAVADPQTEVAVAAVVEAPPVVKDVPEE